MTTQNSDRQKSNNETHSIVSDADEQKRLEILRSYEILDTLPEQSYDDLTKLASTICGTPIALVSLVDEFRQWFKSKVGLTASETPREYAFCAHAIKEPTPFIIENAMEDSRFANNPLVTSDPNIRFYAGIPLISSEQVALGTLCVVDRIPRKLTQEQVESLKALARQVVSMLEARKLNQKLGEEKRRYSSLVNDLKKVVFRTDVQGLWQFLNPAWQETLGYVLEDSLGKPFLDYVHPEDRKKTQELFQSLIERKKENCRHTVRYLTASKEIRWMEVFARLSLDTQGQIIGTTGTLSDITEAVLSEERLNTRKQLLKSFFDSSPMMMGVVELVNDDILHLSDNQSTSRFFEKGANQIEGKLASELSVGPQERSLWINRYRHSQELNRPVSFEYTHRTSQGTRELLATVNFIRLSEAGRPMCSYIVQDISERKQQEQIIAEQQSKLISTSRLTSLGEMAAGIAHEINNPLAIIHSFANRLDNMVKSGSLDQEKLVHFAEKIRLTADRIAKIVRGLRQFAKDGQNEPFQTVPVAQIIENTLDLGKTKFAHHGIDLRVTPECTQNTVLLECKPTQISQVLFSLLSNSYDAVQGTDSPWVEVALKETDHKIEISVTDSGTGISSEIRAKLMQPFFTTKGVGKGTGLGLSISLGIIQSHHGQLTLDETCPNTRFVIQIPRCQTNLMKAS